MGWSTSNESGVRSFVLEKSNNGIAFSVLTTVPAHNNSGVNGYTFNDDIAQKGTIYYRLKVVDNNGSYFYSKTLKISTDNKNQTLYNIYPNPVKNELTVDFNGVSDNIEASVVSLSGKELVRLPLQDGISKKTIEVGQLAKGEYLLVIRGKQGEVNTIKFTK